jgi:hypothetical protein
MGEALRLHVWTHLTCLRRNRVFHAFLALVAVGLALAMVPALAFDDDSNRFQTLRGLAHLLHGTTSIVTSGIGLFLLWVHRRARSIKMVATTAAPFGAWVASLFATAAMVGAVAHATGAVLVLVLSWAWGVTYQYGFVYLALDRFVESLIGLGIVTTLGAVLHPVITIVLVTLVNESIVLTIRQGLELLSPGPVLAVVKAAATGLYYLLPSLDPFGERTRALVRTMRVAESDWQYLAAGAGYAALMLAFAYVTTSSVLTRRPGT